MKPSFVADVGNSRIKWGRCRNGIVGDAVALAADDARAWQVQFDSWGGAVARTWAVSGVQPRWQDALVRWLRDRRAEVTVLASWKDLPLRVDVEAPDAVGMDRLLNAVAANARRPEGIAAVVIDAGSAVTVDWLDSGGTFCGGSIFPGLRLMAHSLHEHTALLPLLEVTAPSPLPGRSTADAIRAGVFWALAGGIAALAGQLTRNGQVASASPPWVCLTGGDAIILEQRLAEILAGGPDVGSPVVCPQLTLEGIGIAADSQR